MNMAKEERQERERGKERRTGKYTEAYEREERRKLKLKLY